MEKVALVAEYRSKGLRFQVCLDIVGLTRNQYYYKPTGEKSGKRPTTTTKYKDPQSKKITDVKNEVVVDKIIRIKQDVDSEKYYKLICVKLCLLGYYINHKKVYRLMSEYSLLEEVKKKGSKQYVKHRRVVPIRPLQVIEMDIKYIWINRSRKYAFVLTIIDTFTRYVLCYSVGYCMKTEQVKQAWEYVIATYFQGVVDIDCELQIEIRNDNGKQFSSEEIKQFFQDNYMQQVFTHPYTPQENGHIESFHKTLGESIKDDVFETLADAEKRLDKFYNQYNNHKTHTATIVPPAKFWVLFDMGLVEVVVDEKKRRSKYKLKVALQDVYAIQGIARFDNWVIRA